MKKLLVSLLIGCVTLGVGCGEAKVSKDKYDELLKKYEDTVCQLEQFKTDNGILEDENEKLSKKVDTAKDYLELDPTEKELVDAKIVEVNQATEDQLAQEKAQKEAEEKAKKEAEEEAKRQAEEEERLRKEEEERQKAEAEAHKYETGLTWEQIAREGKVGTLGQFEGKIVQVMNGSGFTQYRVAINGDYDTIMLVEVLDGVSSETLLEDDYVYFKGMSMGQYTYTTVMGAEMTIPSFIVDEIHR